MEWEVKKKANDQKLGKRVDGSAVNGGQWKREGIYLVCPNSNQLLNMFTHLVDMYYMSKNNNLLLNRDVTLCLLCKCLTKYWQLPEEKIWWYKGGLISEYHTRTRCRPPWGLVASRLPSPPCLGILFWHRDPTETRKTCCYSRCWESFLQDDTQ